MTADTPGVILRPLDVAEATAMVSAHPRDTWVEGFPTADDRFLAELLLAGGDGPTSAGSAFSEWTAYLVIESATGLVVGTAGFKGPPRDGIVEIGYGLAPAARGRGLATAAVMALLELAMSDSQVVAVEAETLPGNDASERVLLRCGFAPVGERGEHRLFRRTGVVEASGDASGEAAGGLEGWS